MRDIQKRRGERESPWNMPILMLIFLDCNAPSVCFRVRVVFSGPYLLLGTGLGLVIFYRYSGILVSSHGAQSRMPFCKLSRL